jgi:hypothetical protein
MTLLALRPYGAVALRHSVPAGVPIVILATRTRCAAAAGVRPGRRPRGRCVRAWGGGACGGVAGHGTTALGAPPCANADPANNITVPMTANPAFISALPLFWGLTSRPGGPFRKAMTEAPKTSPVSLPPGKTGNPAEPFLRGAIMLIGLSKAGSILAPLRWRLISNLADALF